MRFIAPIDTTVFEVAYLAGEEINTSGWNRAQYLQFLDSGLIAPTLVAVDPISAVSYVHVQSAPLAVWNITHTLAFTPNVTVVDSTGQMVDGDVEIISATQIRITFSAAFSGTAYLS